MIAPADDGCKRLLGVDRGQLVHLKSAVLARLTAMLPETNRTLSIRLKRILP